jgi:TetR/AcrR family transcriptional regulator, cholesterol catabolism regulator
MKVRVMKAREQAMLEAALPVFKSRGIRGTHLSEVAQAGGIRLQELKTQFSTKKILVQAFVEYLLVRHTAYLHVNPVLSPSAITELHNFFQFIESLTTELTPTILHELEKYSTTGWSKLTEFKDQVLVPYLQQNLKRGVKEGFYRCDVDLDLYVTIYFNLLYVIVTELNSQNGDSRELLPQFHKILLRGLLSARGVRM